MNKDSGTRTERKTLAKYSGKSVTVIATFEKADEKRKVHQSFNKKERTYTPTNLKEPDMIYPIYRVDPDVRICPCRDLNAASCINNIHGTGDTSDINETHMFIQEKLRGCESGDKVKINGIIREYNDDKKKLGYDYYIEPIGYKIVKKKNDNKND